MLCLLFNSTHQGVTLFDNQTEHTHESIDDNKPGINDTTKKAILVIIKDRGADIGAKVIKSILRGNKAERIMIPSKTQINNFVQYTKRKRNDKLLSLGDLIAFLKTKLEVPIEENSPFVVAYQSKFDENDKEASHRSIEDIPINCKSFRCFMSSRRLIKSSHLAKTILADSTYKLLWFNFPVLICGFNDRNNCFHPIGLAISTNENQNDYHFLFQSIQIGLEGINLDPLPTNGSIHLMADAADAITIGFANVFGANGFSRGMCWFHMKKAIMTNVTRAGDKQTQEAIVIDIDHLQNCLNKKIFDVATNLFIEKWSKTEGTDEFLTYFQNEWVRKHPGWYKGCIPGSGCTNNSLEATNGVIKDQYTYRERLAIADFFTMVFRLITDWSTERDTTPGNQPTLIALTVDIQLKDYTAGYNWNKSAKPIKLERVDSEHFFVKSTKSTLNAVNQNDVIDYQNNINGAEFETFQDFVEQCFSIWHITFPKINGQFKWQDATCTCPEFHKSNICKHIIGIAHRYSWINIPTAAKDAKFAVCRERGRPPGTTTALHKQPAPNKANQKASANAIDDDDDDEELYVPLSKRKPTDDVDQVDTEAATTSKHTQVQQAVAN